MMAVAQQRDSHPPDPVTIFEFLSRNEWVTRCGAGQRPSGHSTVIAINEGRPDRLCHRQGSNAMSRSGRPPSCTSQWQDLHTVPDRVSSAMPLHYDAVRTGRAGLTIVTSQIVTAPTELARPPARSLRPGSLAAASAKFALCATCACCPDLRGTAFAPAHHRADGSRGGDSSVEFTDSSRAWLVAALRSPRARRVPPRGRTGCGRTPSQATHCARAPGTAKAATTASSAPSPAPAPRGRGSS
jgi:hypothetical protein